MPASPEPSLSYVLALLESRLRPRALIVADNADDSPEYLARLRSHDGGYLSMRLV